MVGRLLFGKGNYRWAAVALAIIIIDQIFKFVIRASDPMIRLTRFFNIMFVRNTGAGFGILKDQFLFILLLNLAVIAVLLYVLKRIEYERMAVLSMVLVLAGALGNLIDRVIFGYVTDFINFSFWPAFNVADMAVSLGAALLAYLLIRNRISFKHKVG